MIKKLFFTFILVLSASFLYSQNDTIIASDGTVLVGELKDMNKGVITFKTDYSDSDFKIEWLKINSIKTERTYRIVLNNGDRYFGRFKGDKINGIKIFDEFYGVIVVKLEDIVYIKHIDVGGILDVMTLNLDVGYSYTKSNNLHQLNGALHIDYNTNIWGFSLNATTVQSLQDDVEPTKRSTLDMGLKKFLRRSLYGGFNADYFSNNEQNLDLRSNYKLVIGNYFYRSNRQYLNSNIGFSYSLENYADTIEDRRGMEANVTLEYNAFDIGDLNFYTIVTLYPSLSEVGRLRTELKSNIKYDLPRDFYIKVSLDYKYDTKPVEGAIPDDFVFTAGIGWEL